MSKLFIAANRVPVIVDNDAGGEWVLPETGGVGTIVLTVVGILLIGAALILLIIQKKGK